MIDDVSAHCLKCFPTPFTDEFHIDKSQGLGQAAFLRMIHSIGNKTCSQYRAYAEDEGTLWVLPSIIVVDVYGRLRHEVVETLPYHKYV